MSILQEVLNWSKTIAPWQSDALARLLTKQTLDAADIADLYAMLKSSREIADPQARQPNPLDQNQIPAPVQKTTQVSLLAIKNLCCVNAIAEKERIPIAPTGLTVIYGDNGSGKSGYTRVLKKACRARDQAEVIRPNAQQAGTAGLAKADFEISINGGPPQDVHWTFGKPAPAELSALSIFDARCARAYLDDEDDFSYVPYGLDVFEGLAKLCRELKGKLDAEHAQYATDLAAFAHLHGETAVGKLIAALSAKTEPQRVEALATLAPEELARQAELEKSLRESNPADKAKQLRAFARRVAAVAAAARAKGATVNVDAVAALRVLADAYRAAQATAALAADKFKAGGNLLPGTGGEVWRALFEAARAFALESHAGHTFPDLGAESPCPLCQQPLHEGAERLLRFEEFIQADAEKNVQRRRAALQAAYSPFAATPMTISLDDVTHSEIEGVDKQLAADARTFEAALSARQELIKTAIKEHQWDRTETAIANPDERLKALADALNTQADTLEKAADEKARAALELEFGEIEARRKLGLVKEAVLIAIGRLSHQAALQKCQADVKTTGISLKSSEITEKVVSAALESALNKEFKALGVGSLRVTLKSRGDKGKALHKLKLGLPQVVNPADILSEGEQRAIAIGSFLAEINLGGGKGGVVFDDPVSSLDHARRERVARRIAAEAAIRQVIVFTHDIYFLCLLAEEAHQTQVPIMTQSLVRRPQGFGVAHPELPFEGQTAAKRIGTLKSQHQVIDKLHRAGDAPAHKQETVDAYFRLRLTWERAVEEVLLRGVVLRFRKGVETQKLAGVTVEDDDYKAVNAGMTKCSNYAHDKAYAGGVAVPEPDELLQDIEALDDWRKSIESRSVATAKARK